MQTPGAPLPPINHVAQNYVAQTHAAQTLRSSPIRVENEDYLRLLEEYVRWQMGRLPSSHDELQHCLQGFQDDGMGLDDIQRFSATEWAERGVRKGLGDRLRREIKSFLEYQARNDAASALTGLSQ